MPDEARRVSSLNLEMKLSVIAVMTGIPPMRWYSVC